MFCDVLPNNFRQLIFKLFFDFNLEFCSKFKRYCRKVKTRVQQLFPLRYENLHSQIFL